jgi:hypothetical protein
METTEFLKMHFDLNLERFRKTKSWNIRIGLRDILKKLRRKSRLIRSRSI